MRVHLKHWRTSFRLTLIGLIGGMFFFLWSVLFLILSLGGILSVAHFSNILPLILHHLFGSLAQVDIFGLGMHNLIIYKHEELFGLNSYDS